MKPRWHIATAKFFTPIFCLLPERRPYSVLGTALTTPDTSPSVRSIRRLSTTVLADRHTPPISLQLSSQGP